MTEKELRAKEHFDHMLFLAEKGNVEAMYHVGGLYLSGLGTKKSYEMGLSWLRHATYLGCRKSRMCLGFLGEHEY